MVPRLKEHSTAMAPAGCAAMGRGPGTATPRRVALGALGGLAHRRRRPGEHTGRQIPLVPDPGYPLPAGSFTRQLLATREGRSLKGAVRVERDIEDRGREQISGCREDLDA